MDPKKVNNILLYCLFVLSLISCDGDKVYDEYISLSEEAWQAKNKIIFEVEIKDSIQKNNVFLNVRTDNKFPYRNLFIISKMITPDGFMVKDTLEYQMADIYGNWLGEGFTEVRNNKLFFLENYQFQKNGNYIFEFEQAVRKRGDLEGEQALKGVLDIGLRIEKTVTK